MTNSQARPGNDNARGAEGNPAPTDPAWYVAAKRQFTAGMRAVEYRESYALQDGKWYAGDSGVFAFMPSDWRKIKDTSRPIVVNDHGEQTFHRTHAEARATVSLATKRINDAKSAKLDAENPFRHAAAQLALLRALRTL